MDESQTENQSICQSRDFKKFQDRLNQNININSNFMRKTVNFFLPNYKRNQQILLGEHIS